MYNNIIKDYRIFRSKLQEKARSNPSNPVYHQFHLHLHEYPVTYSYTTLKDGGGGFLHLHSCNLPQPVVSCFNRPRLVEVIMQKLRPKHAGHCFYRPRLVEAGTWMCHPSRENDVAIA